MTADTPTTAAPQHTPGPWKHLTIGRGTLVVPSDKRVLHGREVAIISPTSEVGVEYANAALIAAAPDLLAALREAVPQMQEDRDALFSCGTLGDDPATLDDLTARGVARYDELLATMRAALSRAEGRA